MHFPTPRTYSFTTFLASRTNEASTEPRNEQGRTEQVGHRRARKDAPRTISARVASLRPMAADVTTLSPCVQRLDVFHEPGIYADNDSDGSRSYCAVGKQ